MLKSAFAFRGQLGSFTARNSILYKRRGHFATMVQAQGDGIAPVFKNSVTTGGLLRVEDPDDGRKQRSKVPGVNYSRVQPTPIKNPHIAIVSDSVMKMIGLGGYASADQTQLAQHLAGNQLWPGSDPVAHCYCGY